MKLRIGKKKFLLGLSVLFVLGVVGGYTYWTRGAAADEYLTGKVERGVIRNTVAATGTLQAVTTVQVGSQVSGTISALYADFNSNVKKGQVVAQLNPAIFQAQVASARANLESARANLADAEARLLGAKATVENQRAGVSSANANLAAIKAQLDDARNQLRRQEELKTAGIVPERDLEVARTNFSAAEARYNQAAAQVEQARLTEKSSASAGLAQAEAGVKQAKAQLQQTEASVRLAEVNLSHTTITSPIDGVVVSRNVDVGQTVAASLSAPTLFTIANDLTQMQVIANIDQADIGVISQSNNVTFTVDAFPGSNFSGRIQQIRLNPQNVSNVVTYNVVIDVENPDLKLKPGMTANLTMTIAERSDVLKIPNSALRFRPQGVTQEQMRDMFRGAGGNRQGRDEREGGQATPQPTAEGAQPAAENREGGQNREGRQGREAREGGPERRPREGRAAGEGRPSRDGRSAGEGSTARRPAGEGEGRAEGARRGGIAPPTTPLLEGQRRIVWVLGADKKPQPRRIRIGITDGAATEIIEGELQEGDTVIVGQNITGETRTQSGQPRPPGFGGGFGGPGGRPGGGGGRR